MKLIAMVAGLFLAASAAHAATQTLTFDNIPTGNGECQTSTEKSFRLICAASDFRLGAIHLDDSPTSVGDYVEFKLGSYLPDDISRLFSPISLAIRGIRTAFGECASGSENCYDSPDFIERPYENLILRGFRNGVAVAMQGVSSFGYPNTVFDVSFSPEFAQIDLLRITQVKGYLGTSSDFPMAYCQDGPCGHVDINSFTVDSPAPVPLPAGLPLLTFGLASMAFLRKKSSKVYG